MMRFVGVDIGFGETKAVFVDETGEIINSISFPTLVAEYTPAPLEKEKLVLSLGRNYVIGRDAKGEPGCFQLVDFEDMREFAPLLLQGVIQMGYGEQATDIAVCASIPPGWWRRKEEFLQALRKEVSTVVVIPQGQGAFITVRESNDLEDGEIVLVLDFGYNTVDYLLIEVTKGDTSPRMDFLITKGNTLPRMGVTKLVQFFRGELKGEFSELPDRVLKEMLRTGQGRLYGEKIDLSGHKRRAIEKYCTMLMRELKNNVGEIWRDTDAIICTGGGVYYFNPKNNLSHYRIIVPEEPEFANARGQALWIAKMIKG